MFDKKPLVVSFAFLIGDQIFGIIPHISHTFPALCLLGNALFWRQCSLHGLVASLLSFLVIERFVLSWEEDLEGYTSDQTSFILVHSCALVLQ